MKYNNIIFLGLCLGLTTYSALSADSVIKISGRVLDYGCTVSSDSLNFTVDLQKNSARQFPTTGSTSPVVPFQITLSECSKGTTGVRVAFNGIEDAENNTLLKLDEATEPSVSPRNRLQSFWIACVSAMASPHLMHLDMLQSPACKLYVRGKLEH